MEEFKVTPWEVEGEVNYEKLIKDFGLKFFDESLVNKLKERTKDLSVLFRRKFVIAHRDFDLVLEEKDFFLYTGRGPSGKMHLGHIIPFMLTKWLQEKFDANVYIQITDDEKFLEPKRKLTLEETRKFAEDNILDIIAVGFDKDKTFIFQNTEYIGNFYRLALRIAKKLNFSIMRAAFGFNNQSNIGIIFYPAVQMAVCFFENKRCLIPASIDQDPYWRLVRDISDKLGYKKPSTINTKFLIPLTGPKGKMSSSIPQSAIFLDDNEKTVREKIYKYAFSGGQPSVELHRRLGGNPNVDVCFQWLYSFLEENDEKIKRIEEDYRSGKLLTGELKEYAIEKINQFLKNHRKNKEKAEKLVEYFKYKGKLAEKMWNTNFI